MFLAKNSSLGDQKRPFWAEMGVYKSGIFSNTISKCTENWFWGHIRGGKNLVPLIDHFFSKMARLNFWPVLTSRLEESNPTTLE